MTIKEIIVSEFSQIKGQLVLLDFKVSRLIGVVEDEEDFYWCLYDGQQIQLSSCLTNIVTLKGKIDIQDYNEMIRVCKLNHNDQPISFSWANEDEVESMVEMYKQQLLAGCYRYNHFIAGPDWSLSQLQYTH